MWGPLPSGVLSTLPGPTQVVDTCPLSIMILIPRTSVPGSFAGAIHRAWTSATVQPGPSLSQTVPVFPEAAWASAHSYGQLNLRELVRKTHGVSSTHRNRLYYSTAQEEWEQAPRHIMRNSDSVHQSRRMGANAPSLIIWVTLCKSHSPALSVDPSNTSAG